MWWIYNQEDSQRFISKGGSVMREYVKFYGTTWRNQSDLLKTDIITKGTKRRAGEEVSAIDQYKIGHFSEKKNKMINEKAHKIWNELQNDEASSCCSATEICLKRLHRIPGHLKGRSVSTKQILAKEKLRMDLELEKKKSKALEEEIRVINEKHILFQESQTKFQEEQKEKMEFMMGELTCSDFRFRGDMI